MRNKLCPRHLELSLKMNIFRTLLIPPICKRMARSGHHCHSKRSSFSALEAVAIFFLTDAEEEDEELIAMAVACILYHFDCRFSCVSQPVLN
jgi:hypothetical protein